MVINKHNLTLLFSKDVIDQKVAEIAKDISDQFEKKDPIFIGVLNGSFIFLADLLRKVTIDCEMDFIILHSYDGDRSAMTAIDPAAQFN
jgi:hypoxanthine phosphoribosyltransferase